MGHYDQQYEERYEQERVAFAKKVEADAAHLGVPVVSIRYTVVALCRDCGGKIYQIDEASKSAGQLVPCGCRRIV